MLFKYHAIDQDGHERDGTIEAPSKDVAISALQRRNLVISVIESSEKQSLLERSVSFFGRIPNKDVVILSRQIATLFEAQVSALRVFRLLSVEVENTQLAAVLSAVGDDLKGKSHQQGARAPPEGLHGVLCEHGSCRRRVGQTV